MQNHLYLRFILKSFLSQEESLFWEGKVHLWQSMFIFLHYGSWCAAYSKLLCYAALGTLQDSCFISELCEIVYIYNAIKIATIKTSFRPRQNAFLLHLFQVVRTTLRRRMLPIRLAGSQLGAAEARVLPMPAYICWRSVYADGQCLCEVCGGVLDCTLFRSIGARYTSQLSMCHCLGRCADLLNILVDLGLVSVSGLICI